MDNKIFITLGSQKFQFNRLLKAVDELCEKGTVDAEDVFAQIGYSDYLPKNFSYKKFLDRDEFSNEMEKANIVITHGGTGAIIGAVKRGKKVIAVPRLAKYGEHVDDHQLQLIKQFDDLNLICSCHDVGDLETALDTVQQTKYNSYKSNTINIINSIEEYADSYIFPDFLSHESYTFQITGFENLQTKLRRKKSLKRHSEQTAYKSEMLFPLDSCHQQ